MPERDPVTHAKAYPFPSPDFSFLFRNGRAEPLTDHVFDRTTRTPVLAAGSNRSPEQLARKYPAFGSDSFIPAELGLLHGFDSVYAGHFARYGSVPATFFPSPGTAVSTFVLWLDTSQLERMHETERNHYAFIRMDGLRFVLEDARPGPGSAWAYLALTGCITLQGSPVALAEVPARGRRFAAKSQVEMQDFVRGLVAPDKALDASIGETIRDPALRQKRIHALAEHTTPTPGLNASDRIGDGLTLP